LAEERDNALSDNTLTDPNWRKTE